MKILITGASGYLGGRLVQHWSQQKEHQLRILVRNTEDVFAQARSVELWQGDLTQPSSLKNIGHTIDTVIHLAALNEVVCGQDPIAALRVNVEGTLNLLEALNDEIEHVVYLSTFHVYGANAHGTITETTTLAPTHPYAITHAMAAMYVSMYARRHQYSATILRLANAYGAPLHKDVDRWSLLINDLCRQAIQKRKLILKTSGEQLRNFIAIPDVISAIETVISHPNNITFYNLGHTQHSILEIAQTIQSIYEKLFDQPLPIERPISPSKQIPSDLDFRSDKIQLLGWQASTGLEDGIAETLLFCHTNFEN